MRQIPRTALTHSVIYYEYDGVNEYGEPSYKSTGVDEHGEPLFGVSVLYVRCEPVKQTALRALGEMKDDKLILFYDCVNSLPASIVFKPFDKIVFNSQDYIIRTVGNYAPHHVELFLK